LKSNIEHWKYYPMSSQHKKTKIVSTLGPVSSNLEMITKLGNAGVNVFRLNFSHGDHTVHEQTIQHILKYREQSGNRPSILADLQGPKIRMGMNLDENGDDGIAVNEGETVVFTTVEEKAKPLEKRFMVRLESFAKDVKMSDRILIDDGKMQFKVLESNGIDEVKLQALNEGLVKSKKGVNMPDTIISVPSLTEKDKTDLTFILTQPVDWLALSFVRSAEDMIDLKNRVTSANRNIKIIAKVEKPEALVHIDEIVKASDGVMVARGDLGVEIPFEKVPLAQKKIVKSCIKHAKPVIIATQVMESMIENPTPTRAEITDVANVVLEGADAVMLSGETSVGKYPVEVIETISKTILELEQNADIYSKTFKQKVKSDTPIAEAISSNAVKLSENLNAEALVVMTKTGYTANMVSRYRPSAPIYAFTDQQEVINQLSLLWGVQTFYYDGNEATDVALPEIHNILKSKSLVNDGDIVVNTASMPIHNFGKTNMMKVSKIGE